MLPRALRLTKTEDFSKVYKYGKRLFSAHLRVSFLSLPQRRPSTADQNPSRFGFVVSKKQAREIVARNRLKRILRAEVLSLRSRLSGGHFVVIQARQQGQGAPARILREELRELLAKARLLTKKHE